MALTHSTEEMFQNLEYATNYGGRLAGRADAVANVGKLLTGEYTPERLSDIHEEVLNGTDPAYETGYKEAWNSLFNLVYGVEPNKLDTHLGPMTTS
jgi:hypothetical protein